VHTELFEQHRSRLTGIAYGMLGSLMDAEDVVQDTYLRWAGIDLATVDAPAAFLTTMCTRIAIDRLRSARVRRERYVGPWLPEPIIGSVEPDPADVVGEAESLSLAMLVALERLQPVERAVLLLREVFDYDYTEIADIVDKSPANCRQIAVRARERAGDLSRSRPTSDAENAIISRYVEAVTAGDVDRLAEIFADDVVLWADGGGKARAARHPLFGATRVARHLVGVQPQTPPGTEVRLVRANGEISILGLLDGTPIGLIVFEVQDDLVIGVRALLNPEKLERLQPAD
jgi:RNA polymerase sigma-70 factor (ECF subfamily)